MRPLEKEISIRHMLALALPMIVSNASETVMLFLNRWFVSQLGAEYIAPSMIGGLTSFVFTSLFTGIIGYVNAISAQYHGAGRDERCVQAASQGLWLSLAFYPLLVLLIPVGYGLFSAVGHVAKQLALEFSYYRILMWGSFLYLIQAALTGYFLGLGKTRVIMLANALGIFVNVPLNWCFVFGKLGFPALGIEGAAYGTMIGTLFIVGILFIAYIRSRAYRENRGWEAWKPRKDLLSRLLRYGLPAGLESFINVFAFNTFVLLMDSYNLIVRAAVTITFNYDLVAFIPMLGVGAATTAMVGHRMGAGDPLGAKRVAFLGLRVAWSYGALMVILFVAGAPMLVRFFSRGFTAADQPIIPLAETMLRLAAIYTLADGTQVVFSGALRGAGDTRWVMILSGALHWTMATGAFIFIKILVLPPLVVWLFFICFVLSMGVSMFLRHRGGKWMRIRLVEAAPPAA